MGCSHRDSALPAALAVGYFVDAPMAVRLGAGVLVWVSSTWPDYDHPMHSRIHPGAIVVGGFARVVARSRGPRDVVRADVHRGASHSIGGMLYLGILTAAVSSFIPPIAPWWWLWAICVMVGVAVHIAGDCLTPSGCPILWPLMLDGRRFHRYSLDVFSTGDDVNEPLVGMLVFRPLTALVLLAISGHLASTSQLLFGLSGYGAVPMVLAWLLVAVAVLLCVRWVHRLGRTAWVERRRR